MKKFLMIILVIAFTVTHAIAQDTTEVLLHIPERGKAIGNFTPAGYHIISTAKGDFNKDGKEDKVIVLENKKPEYKKYPGFKRLVILLLKTKDGWALAGRNDNLMLDADMNNDPMLQIDTKGNTVDIEQITYAHGILSSFKTLFKYENGDFYLTRQTNDSSSIQVKCEKLGEYRSKRYEEINFETGVRKRKKISYYCELLMDKTDTLDVKPIKISEVKTEL